MDVRVCGHTDLTIGRCIECEKPFAVGEILVAIGSDYDFPRQVICAECLLEAMKQVTAQELKLVAKAFGNLEES